METLQATQGALNLIPERRNARIGGIFQGPTVGAFSHVNGRFRHSHSAGFPHPELRKRGNNMETIFQGIVDIIGALPDGPYFVFESPFPAMEQISNGGDTNFGSTFGDLNVGSTDILDITDDNSTNIEVGNAEIGG